MNTMKSLINIIFLALLTVCGLAQNPIYNTPSSYQADSMMEALKTSHDDSSRMRIYAELSPYYFNINTDSAVYFGQQSLLIAKKLHQKLWQAYAENSTAYAFYLKGSYISALQLLLDALQIAGSEETERNIWSLPTFFNELDPHKARLNVLAYTHLNLAFMYLVPGNTQQQEANYLKGVEIGMSINDPATLGIFRMNLANFYLGVNKLDSALETAHTALEDLNTGGVSKYAGVVMINIGDIYTAKGNYDSADIYYRKALVLNIEQELYRGVIINYRSLAKLYLITSKADSAIYYAKKGIELGKEINATGNLYYLYNILSSAYHLRRENDSAYFNLKTAVTLQDSLYNKQKINQFQDIGFSEQLHKQEVENQKAQYQNRIRTYALLSGIAACLLIAFFLYRNNRNRRKANELLHRQKKEIETQKKNVETTLAELKSTQAQLIQSEKMASLGELTAGIAHEIQNPLNFINNFSEVNTELIVELKNELTTGNQQLAMEIADDIKINESKINHHGKRADAIVKGMLQHSRSSTGLKELTNINALADEYLRLAYHGLRAKDKEFNVTMKTDFDETIGTINIIPQDIGRVLLNLYNNAFYAVNEKKKNPQPLKGSKEYEPTVAVSTRSAKSPSGDLGVILTVTDNGNGIPQNIVDKIFQPFYTTKPTGEGTGLGLSLSYDIIRSHGGKIRVETKEGEGSSFIIELPSHA